MMAALLFVGGLVLLVAGADWLVRGASALASAMGLSQLTIGLTVVALGTSLPELVVSLLAATDGNSAIALGNVLGSCSANILLILGLSALIAPLQVTRRTAKVEIPLCILAGVAVALLMLDQRIGRGDGALLLVVFVIFMGYVWKVAREPGTAGSDAGSEAPVALHRGAAAFFIVIGLAALVGGGRLVVTGAVQLGTALGLSDAFVGLTVVAVGTSLPELATSLVAAWRRNTDIAIGNVVGSNIFNVFFILGTTTLVQPIVPPPSAQVDAALVTGAAVLLAAAMWTGRKYLLERWEGAILLLVYGGYVAWLAVTL